MTLKTLKELNWGMPWEGMNDDVSKDNIEEKYVKIEDLKAEAIAWIKWFNRNSDAVDIYENETKPTDLVLSNIIDKDNFIKECKKEALDLSYKRCAINAWIKHFFNITSEDLMGVK